MITEVAVKQTKRGVDIQQIIQLWKISHSKLFVRHFKNVTTKKLLWHSVEIYEYFRHSNFYLKLRIGKINWNCSKSNGVLFWARRFFLFILYFFGIKLKSFSRKIWVTENIFLISTLWLWGVVLSLLLSQKDFSSTLDINFKSGLTKKPFFNSSVLSIFFGSSIGTTFLQLTFFRLINDGLNFVKIVNNFKLLKML